MKLNLCALLFAGGAYLIWFLPWLIPAVAIPLVLFFAFVSLNWFRQLPAALFLVGLSWGVYHGNEVKQTQVSVSTAGIEARIVGRVSSIPRDRGISQRFEFEVETFEMLSGLRSEQTPKNLLLSWYRSDKLVQVGDQYQFEVKLRRPRGLSNFGQFDYRRWLLGQQFDATGYVRHSEYLGVSNRWTDRVNKARQFLHSEIVGKEFENEALIAALGLGFKEDLQVSQWQLFVESGVVHLMVISGLHIGFAGLIGFGLGGWFAKPFLILGCLRNDLGVRCAGTILFALFYAVLAGLSLPTFRALIMLLVLICSRLFNLSWSGWTLLSLCLAAVALLQPHAVLQDSFWLSFGAVLVLVVSLSGRPKLRLFRSLFLAQCMLFCGFGGLLLSLGKPVYLAGLVANLVAVPLTGFILVPMILISVLFLPVAPGLSISVLHLVDRLLSLLLAYLEFLSGLSLPHIDSVMSSGLSAAVICVAGLIFVSFPSLRIRLLLAFVLLPLVFSDRNEEPDFSMLVFDVGQGTSVLIEQPQYRLLYDTGPAFSAQFNAGADILVPHIRVESSRLEALILSHDDSDHSGGFLVLQEQLQIGEVFMGGRKFYEEENPKNSTLCSDGMFWTVDQVSYRFLHPRQSSLPSSSNNQSCVLLIEFAGTKLLLAGDVENLIESDLMKSYPDLGDIDWLLVPHHGSKTSSSEGFVSQLNPNIAVVSAGYGNSFGHPAKEVVDRYERYGSEVLSTAEQGALLFTWSKSDAEMQWESSRGLYRFWWQE